MKVALVHNHYREAGGEDQVFRAEAELLEEHGHTVVRYAVQNDEVDRMTRLALAAATTWNNGQYRTLRALFSDVRPDVVHVHNTLPLISPAVYYAARRSGAAVVQTLHNYRLVCPSALLFRNGAPCELCVGKLVPWPGIVHRCYRGDRAATGAVAAMLASHRTLATYRRMVDRYIALTEFAKEKFVQGGLPRQRIEVKPNFVRGGPLADARDGGYALFVGRLSAEKGVMVLLDAWREIGARLPLRIAGAGALSRAVKAAAAELDGVEYLGPLPSPDVRAQMGAAAVVVVPSLWYETFGLVVAEAFASGTPVIGSRHGALAEIIEDGRTGLHVNPGDPRDLERAVRWVLENPRRVNSMGREARREHERRYSPDANYDMLVAIYENAIRQRGRPTKGA